MIFSIIFCFFLKNKKMRHFGLPESFKLSWKVYHLDGKKPLGVWLPLVGSSIFRQRSGYKPLHIHWYHQRQGLQLAADPDVGGRTLSAVEPCFQHQWFKCAKIDRFCPDTMLSVSCLCEPNHITGFQASEPQSATHRWFFQLFFVFS